MVGLGGDLIRVLRHIGHDALIEHVFSFTDLVRGRSLKNLLRAGRYFLRR